MLSGWGILISFWCFLLHFFSIFLPWNRLSGFFCVSRSLCIVFRLLRRRLFLFLRFLWPFFSSCFGPHDFAFEQDCSCSAPRSSSVGPNFRCCVSCREPLCPFPSLALPLFPALFPAFVSSSALDVASLFSSVAGTLRFPPFCVSLHRCFYRPRLLLSIFWHGGSRLRLLHHMFFQRFFTQQKLGLSRATGVYVWPESRTLSGKINY